MKIQYKFRFTEKWETGHVLGAFEASNEAKFALHSSTLYLVILNEATNRIDKIPEDKIDVRPYKACACGTTGGCGCP